MGGDDKIMKLNQTYWIIAPMDFNEKYLKFECLFEYLLILVVCILSLCLINIKVKLIFILLN